MMGAIVGDIIGSVHEFKNEKVWDDELFPPGSKFTDDTVMTVATAQAILQGDTYEDNYAAFYKMHPNRAYGMNFIDWAMSSRFYRKPYDSLGNGSAMRVSPIGWAYDDPYEVMVEAQQSSACSHNHLEGIRGAQAVALSVWLARTGASPATLRDHVEDVFGYDLDLDLEHLHENYTFNATCPGSVPQALACVFQAKDFESTMRNCLYIGGDTDTICAIAGSIAEPLFGIPEAILDPALEILGKEPMLLGVTQSFEQQFGRRVAPKSARFDILTKLGTVLNLLPRKKITL